MRGVERPSKVRWTRPFLVPLKPLSDDAARKTFNAIADDSDDSEEKDRLLRLTDNMPLAVDLIAHLVDYEGLSSVLARWETEKTGLISAGYDKKSNLDASIAVSVASPRITSGAKELLSLLSILPDGLSDIELIQSNFPIKNIRGCKAALLATSLAYIDDKRLRSLVPIREHIKLFSPPSQLLIQPIRRYFNSLLDLFEPQKGTSPNGIFNQITLNLANLQEVLQQGLHVNHPDLVDTIQCIISLNYFYRITGRGGCTLMDYIPPVFPQPCNHRLEASFITELLMWYQRGHNIARESWVTQGLCHFQHFDDPTLKCEFLFLFFSILVLINDYSQILWSSRSLPFPFPRGSCCSYAILRTGTGFVKLIRRSLWTVHYSDQYF